MNQVSAYSWKTIFLKSAALLSLIRWYNVLLTMIAQYFAAFFVYNAAGDFSQTFFDYKLHLIVASTAFLIAAGFIINSFYDFEKDLINKKGKIIFSKLVSRETCLNAYVFLLFFGLLIGFIASFKIFIFMLAFSFGLWFYSHKLKRYPLIKEIGAALLTVTSFFSIMLHYGALNKVVFVFGVFFFLVVFIREFVKDQQSIKGDVLYGVNSFAVTLGELRTNVLCVILSISAAIPAIWLYVHEAFRGVSSLIVVLTFAIIAISLAPFIIKDKRIYEGMNNAIKLIILIAIALIVFLQKEEMIVTF